MRTAWERGDAAPAIALAHGVKTKSVANYAFRLKWKRKAKPARPRPAASAAAAVPTKPGVEQLAGRVRCPSCHMMTITDPCESCGKQIPRRW